MTGITISPARPADLDELIAVARAAFSETYDPLGEKPEGATRKYGELNFTREKILPHLLTGAKALPVYLLARVDGEAAGFSVLERAPLPPCIPNPNSVCFSGSYVARRFHGRGIGRRFFEARRELARDLGFTGIWLGSWCLNEPAVAFHRHLGFQVVGEQDWTFDAGDAKWHCRDLVLYQDL